MAKAKRTEPTLTVPLVPKTAASKVNRAHASRTEDMMELEFSDEFLAFLDRHNGGVPATPNFRLGANVKVVERFLCLVSNYRTHPLGELDIGVVWSSIEDRLDEFLLPFAAVYPGDFLCFDFTELDDAPVVLWVHDRSREGKPHTVPVADNFRAFLGMLFDAEKGSAPPGAAKEPVPRRPARRRAAGSKPARRSKS